MGRKVLVAVICLTLGSALGHAENENKSETSAHVKDNESAESVQKPYHKGHLTVYASAVPHLHTQPFKGPVIYAASSQFAPVYNNGLDSRLVSLKDSYGKLVQTPHATYKPSYPQQFVRLQDLPPHLAQPLASAAAPSFRFNEAPNFVYGPNSYKIKDLKLPASYAAPFNQPLVFVDDLKGLSNSVHKLNTPEHEFTITAHNNAQLNRQPQKSNLEPHYPRQAHSIHQPQHSNQTPYLSKQEVHHLLEQAVKKFQEEPKKQGQQSAYNKNANNRVNHQGHHPQAEQIQSSPAQTHITTIVNGKRTVVNVETIPPVPLLDLSLLEPLKFDNPLVPQLQHYLPKVKGATYYKLPAQNFKKSKKGQKDFIITKTKSYDVGPVKGKTNSEEKKPHKPRTQNKPTPSKPGITVKGYPNSGDYSYEINTPNHKETYNEQVVKYNKETNMKPVEYSYSEKTHKEPEVYTYVHSSKEPLKVTHVEYNSDEAGPKQVVYHSTPQDKEEKQSDKVNHSDAPSISDTYDSEESSDSEEDQLTKYHNDAPKKEEQQFNEYNHQHESPAQPGQGSIVYGIPEEDQYYHDDSSKHSLQPQHRANVQAEKKHPSQPNYHGPNQTPELPRYSHEHVLDGIPRHVDFEINQEGEIKPLMYNDPPSHLLKAEHREHEPIKKPIQKPLQPPQIVQSFAEPPQSYQVAAFNVYQPEYEEEIRIIPKHEPHSAPIKVNPSQHLPKGPTMQTHLIFHTNEDLQSGKRIPPQQKIQSSAQPHVEEMSKHIIIQETQKSPDDTHSEAMMAEMLERQNGSEEDFEKAYKESAFGFPAYEKVADDIEKDIFDPDSYGTTPHYHSEYHGESSPFQEYQKQGDKFPKFARLSYKDSRDNNQEDYFLDYGLHKPESYTDRMKSKVAYYKMYKAQRPKKMFFRDDDNREKKSAFTLAPSFDFFSSTSAKPKSDKLVQYKIDAPVLYEYSGSQEHPRDNNAYASRPNPRQLQTQFVAPQLQYGFEPITAPLLFAESELATLASNDSPESDNGGTRKKVYRENWYMKKTTTNSKPSQSDSR